MQNETEPTVASAYPTTGSGLNETAPPSPPHVTDALEAALNGLLGATSSVPAHSEDIQAEAENGQNGEAEWEADSSPYESSSSDSESSSDDESDADIRSVQETARLLMEAGDGSDDDEDGKRGKGQSTAQVRSKNEVSEPVPPKPDVEITPEDPIDLLGAVLHSVENSVIIRGEWGDSHRVLDDGSLLCRQDRTVLGIVADVIGNVRQPMYIIRFPKEEDVAGEGIEPGMAVYYSVKHAKFVFTDALRSIKGSDASNLYDEEVGDEEMEFSDDEKEQAHKREQKGFKGKRRGGGQAGDGNGGRRPHPLRNETTQGEARRRAEL